MAFRNCSIFYELSSIRRDENAFPLYKGVRGISKLASLGNNAYGIQLKISNNLGFVRVYTLRNKS